MSLQKEKKDKSAKKDKVSTQESAQQCWFITVLLCDYSRRCRMTEN